MWPSGGLVELNDFLKTLGVEVGQDTDTAV